MCVASPLLFFYVAHSIYRKLILEAVYVWCERNTVKFSASDIDKMARFRHKDVVELRNEHVVCLKVPGTFTSSANKAMHKSYNNPEVGFICVSTARTKPKSSRLDHHFSHGTAKTRVSSHCVISQTPTRDEKYEVRIGSRSAPVTSKGSWTASSSSRKWKRSSMNASSR